MEQMATLITNSGVSIAIIAFIMYMVYKGAPKVLEAYKESNNELVSAIKDLADSFNDRVSELENKVEDIKDKVEDIQTKLEDD